MKKCVPVLLIGIALAGCEKSNVIEQESKVISLQPGEEGEDAYVYEIMPVETGRLNDVKEREEEVLVVGSHSDGEEAPALSYRSFIRFKGLSGIPEGASISRATLYLTAPSNSLLFPDGNLTSRTISDRRIVVRKVSSTWSENEVDWLNMPPSSNKEEVVTLAPKETWNSKVTADVTSLVKEMMANPASNYGFSLMLYEESPNTLLLFSSSENPDAERRPRLVVEYR